MTVATRPRVLCVGMLPPPLGGQAMMFETAIGALRSDMEVDVIDLQAQRNIGESGRLSFNKILILLQILLQAIGRVARFRRYDILYYCPSGPSRIGLLKDIVLVSILRPICRKTVYHFHATGGVAFLLDGNKLLAGAGRIAMFRPDLAIRCADVSPNDAAMCEAREAAILFNGIPDPMAGAVDLVHRDGQRETVFTFVGALTKEKGIFELLEIARILRDNGRQFRLKLVGEGTGDEVEAFDRLKDAYQLGDVVERVGVLRGEAKFDALRGTTLFLFPTYFRAETQPLAVIEAIAMGVPCIGYDWRGLGSIISDDINGYLVPVRDQEAFAARIETVLDSGSLERLSQGARRSFVERFTLDKFREGIHRLLVGQVG